MPEEFGLSTSLPATYLFDLDIKQPKQAYQPYSKVLELGNGTVKRMGYDVIEWYWAYLSDDETITLTAICPNGSAEVYVRSQDENLAWHTYRAKMIWPTDTPEIESDFRMKVTARFKVLETID